MPGGEPVAPDRLGGHRVLIRLAYKVQKGLIVFLMLRLTAVLIRLVGIGIEDEISRNFYILRNYQWLQQLALSVSSHDMTAHAAILF